MKKLKFKKHILISLMVFINFLSMENTTSKKKEPTENQVDTPMLKKIKEDFLKKEEKNRGLTKEQIKDRDKKEKEEGHHIANLVLKLLKASNFLDEAKKVDYINQIDKFFSKKPEEKETELYNFYLKIIEIRKIKNIKESIFNVMLTKVNFFDLTKLEFFFWDKILSIPWNYIFGIPYMNKLFCKKNILDNIKKDELRKKEILKIWENNLFFIPENIEILSKNNKEYPIQIISNRYNRKYFIYKNPFDNNISYIIFNNILYVYLFKDYTVYLEKYSDSGKIIDKFDFFSNNKFSLKNFIENTSILFKGEDVTKIKEQKKENKLKEFIKQKKENELKEFITDEKDMYNRGEIFSLCLKYGFSINELKELIRDILMKKKEEELSLK